MRDQLSNAVFCIVLVVVLISVLLPNTDIAWMRDHWAWFNRPMLLIESMHSAVNLVHAILFLLLGMAARIGMPRWRFHKVVLAFLLFGTATELVQFMIPGRHPRISDVLIDVIAGVLGWLAVRGLETRQ